MTTIWNKIESLSNYIIDTFVNCSSNITNADEDHEWKNILFSNKDFRRAHVEIVDKRANHKIYILHCTIFPHFSDPSPIFGIDAICGKNKISGAFHDFSAAGDPNHFMMEKFESHIKPYQWIKSRELPEWAKQIFSKNMVAVGNLKNEIEIDNFCDLVKTNLNYYIENVGKTKNFAEPFKFKKEQNRYCYYQKQNPQVANSMIAMGIEESKIRSFIENVLFPEIP